MPGTPTSPAQYANFDREKLYGPSDEIRRDTTGIDSNVRSLTLDIALVSSDSLQWTPIPLKIWFWVSYVCVLVSGAIALEVALHFSHMKGGTLSNFGIKNDTKLLILNAGWPTSIDAERGILHYVYVRRCLYE